MNVTELGKEIQDKVEFVKRKATTDFALSIGRIGPLQAYYPINSLVRMDDSDDDVRICWSNGSYSIEVVFDFIEARFRGVEIYETSQGDDHENDDYCTSFNMNDLHNETELKGFFQQMFNSNDFLV